MSDGPARVCRICRQPLPKDVTFCVGCGVQNDADAIHGKQVGFERQIDERLSWLRFTTALRGVFGWWR